FDTPVQAAYAVRQPGGQELSVSLIVFTADGLVHGLNHQGIEMAHWNWPYPLDGVPTVTKPSDQGAVEAFQENVTAFLVATSEKQLKQLVITDNQPATMW